MRQLVGAFVLALVVLLTWSGLRGQTVAKMPVAGATVFIAPMENAFDDYLKNAFQKKKVPLVIVADKAAAQFEITGHSDSTKASTAKKLLKGSFHSAEQASIQMADLQSGDVVFAYSVNKGDSAHGRQSTAEACAKHLKDDMEKRR
jgi:hypothetical protein